MSAAIVVVGDVTTLPMDTIRAAAEESGTKVVVISMESPEGTVRERLEDAIEETATVFDFKMLEEYDLYEDYWVHEERKERNELWRERAKQERKKKFPKWGMNKPRVRR